MVKARSKKDAVTSVVAVGDPPVIGDLPFEAVTPVVAVQRRLYDSDGYQDEAPAEPVEFTMEESSFEEPTESNFQVHHDGSNKGKVKLTSELDYCFTKKAESNATFTWRCSLCPAKNTCKAIVRQKKPKSREFLVDFDQADFTEIPHDSDTKHNHVPDHGNHIRVPIFREAKQVAAKEKFTAPREILYGEIKKRKSIKGARTIVLILRKLLKWVITSVGFVFV